MNVPGTPPLTGQPKAPFPRSARLLLSRDFTKVFGQKTNIVGKLMVIWVGDGGGEGLRLGVVASKRTFRRAVDRNRAKRLLREAFRLSYARFNANHDLVIIARRRILDARRQDVEQELVRLLRKARIPEVSGDMAEPEHPGTGH